MVNGCVRLPCLSTRVASVLLADHVTLTEACQLTSSFLLSSATTQLLQLLQSLTQAIVDENTLLVGTRRAAWVIWTAKCKLSIETLS